MSMRLYIVELLLRIFLMEVLRGMMIPVPYSLSGWSTPVPPAGAVTFDGVGRGNYDRPLSKLL